MSFLLNPYVSAFLSTLFVSTIFYLFKNVIAIYRNKASIKKAELKIIDLSMRYIYAHNKFSLDTLNSIIYGVSVKEKVKIEKLRNSNDFLSWIMIKIIDDFVLDNNRKDENIENIISLLNRTSYTKAIINPSNQKSKNKRKRLITILIVAISFSYIYLGMIYLLTSPEFNEQNIFVRDDDSILIFFMISVLFVTIMTFLLMITKIIKKNTN